MQKTEWYIRGIAAEWTGYGIIISRRPVRQNGKQISNTRNRFPHDGKKEDIYREPIKITEKGCILVRELHHPHSCARQDQISIRVR